MNWEAIQAIGTLALAAIGIITIIITIVRVNAKSKKELINTIDKNIEQSVAHQDQLRKTELAPIQTQVSNHLPTEIRGLRTEIKESEQRIMNRMDTQSSEIRDLLIKYIAKK